VNCKVFISKKMHVLTSKTVTLKRLWWNIHTAVTVHLQVGPTSAAAAPDSTPTTLISNHHWLRQLEQAHPFKQFALNILTYPTTHHGMSNAAVQPSKIAVFSPQPKPVFPFAETAKCAAGEDARWTWSEERKGYVNLGCVKIPSTPRIEFGGTKCTAGRCASLK
jgi:hypothetical protein